MKKENKVVVLGIRKKNRWFSFIHYLNFFLFISTFIHSFCCRGRVNGKIEGNVYDNNIYKYESAVS